LRDRFMLSNGKTCLTFYRTRAENGFSDRGHFSLWSIPFGPNA
jgi:transketolase N-terminal domain/subunit